MFAQKGQDFYAGLLNKIGDIWLFSRKTPIILAALLREEQKRFSSGWLI